MHSGVNIAHFNCTCSFGNSPEMAFVEFSICVPFVDLNRSADSYQRSGSFFCRVTHWKRQTSHHIGFSWISSWTHSYLHVLSSFRVWRRQMIWDGKKRVFRTHNSILERTRFVGRDHQIHWIHDKLYGIWSLALSQYSIPTFGFCVKGIHSHTRRRNLTALDGNCTLEPVRRHSCHS